MKFFNLKHYFKSWSVWAMTALTGLTTIDASTTWLNDVIPENFKPVVYAGLGFIGLLLRAIKQPKLTGGTKNE